MNGADQTPDRGAPREPKRLPAAAGFAVVLGIALAVEAAVGAKEVEGIPGGVGFGAWFGVLAAAGFVVLALALAALSHREDGHGD